MVCSIAQSLLRGQRAGLGRPRRIGGPVDHGAVVDARVGPPQQLALDEPSQRRPVAGVAEVDDLLVGAGEPQALQQFGAARRIDRSEEHTSELQSLMRISYAVFCLKKKKQ